MTYHFLMVNRCQLLMHRFNLWFVLAYSLWEMPVCGQTITHNLNQGLEIKFTGARFQGNVTLRLYGL